MKIIEISLVIVGIVSSIIVSSTSLKARVVQDKEIEPIFGCYAPYNQACATTSNGTIIYGSCGCN